MWPFSSADKEDVEVDCDHEWEDGSECIAYPNSILYEDGRPYINKVEIQREECPKCDTTIRLGTTEYKSFISTDKEVMHDGIE